MSAVPVSVQGETYFRVLFEACGESFIVANEQGQAIDCNPATLDLYQCRLDDILGTTPMDWSPEFQPDGRRSDQGAAEVFARASMGETVGFEWNNLTLDQKPLFVHVTVRRAEVAGQVLYLVISRDLSDRKRAEEEIRQNDITFRKLFEDSAEPILLIGADRVFVECNQAALDLLKMGREDFLNRSPAMISPEFQPDGRRSAEAAQDMMDQAHAKGLHRFDWTCVNSEGGEFIVEVSLMPITVKGQLMLHATWRDVTQRKKIEVEMERLARTDELTGLTSRRRFLEQAETETARSIRYNHPLSLLMLDADHFKRINDQHGHAAGDLVLRSLANVIHDSLRGSDLAGRIGGEEFAILLPETDRPMALEVAERLRNAVEASQVMVGMEAPLGVTVSIGVASLRSIEGGLGLLLSQADMALYRAKNSGRNRVCSAVVCLDSEGPAGAMDSTA